MKRFFIILLSMLILLPNIAIGEDFSLRNGIKFGDSIDDVLNKETVSIDKIDRKIGIVNTVRGSISNISGTYVQYMFDDGKLNQMNYRYPSGGELLASMSYELINNGLIEKYGQPLNDRQKETVVQRGLLLNASFIVVFSNGYIQSSDEWFIKKNGYGVKIEHVSYYDGKEFQHDLSYAIVSDDELKKLEEEKKENKDKLNSQL